MHGKHHIVPTTWTYCQFYNYQLLGHKGHNYYSMTCCIDKEGHGQKNGALHAHDISNNNKKRTGQQGLVNPTETAAQLTAYTDQHPWHSLVSGLSCFVQFSFVLVLINSCICCLSDDAPDGWNRTCSFGGCNEF
jgi:hypothetical protein